MKEDLVREICQKEIETGCYNAKIHGIPIYNFIRRIVRAQYLAQNGIEHIDNTKRGTKINKVIAIIKSIFHLMSLPSNVEYVFKTFRLENVNGVWMDKFYDPIIEECQLDNYIILETNYGLINSNRIHKNKVFYDDALLPFVLFLSSLYKRRYLKKYQAEFDNLFKSVTLILGEDFTIEKKNAHVKNILYGLIKVELYSKLFKKIGARCVIGASRANIPSPICAAKQNKIKVCELQHGIEYGETITYSGYRDPLFIPDVFMMFGDVKPREVYGIEESKMTVVGWALKNYVEKTKIDACISENDVLVLSQPQLTDYTIESLITLAINYPSCNFYLRCHPMEILNTKQKEMIEGQPNVIIQDNSISFVFGIMPFRNVIGTQSTAVYEALSYGKKTALLAMNNHEVRFLKEEDAESFWIIKDNCSFEEFLSDPKSKKKDISIYSSFNKDIFIRQLKA